LPIKTDQGSYHLMYLSRFAVAFLAITHLQNAIPQPAAVVEAEEDVYTYEPANNGAGPLWCHGSTCLVRTGRELFASGLETLHDAKPLNNCRWRLFTRGANGWSLVPVGDNGRTREPSPLATFSDGRFFLSANPTLLTNRETYSGPARPELLQLKARWALNFETLEPAWEGTPHFTEHSYRSLAADGPAKELILFQNIDYTHAEWSFLNRKGNWSAQGKLKWPLENEKPIRVCYPNVALKNRAVYFCGTSDVLEPNQERRAYKKKLTGQDWDYIFGRLYYTWTPDITKAAFHDWIEIANYDKTGGGITLGDLWVAPNGAVHLLWTERKLDPRLRELFFPGEKQRYAIMHAVLREGRIISRDALLESNEGAAQPVPGRARFQITPKNRLFVIFYISGKNAEGKSVSENDVLEIKKDGRTTPPVRVPLKQPFSEFMTATVRAGSPASDAVELFGQRAGGGNTISYARVRLD
jgi:hypothetical protein